MITIRFQKSREERMKDGSVEPGGVDGMCSLTAKFTSAEKTNAADLNQSEKGKSYSSIHWSVSVFKSPKCTLELLSWSRGGVCWMSAYLEQKPASTKSHVHGHWLTLRHFLVNLQPPLDLLVMIHHVPGSLSQLGVCSRLLFPSFRMRRPW